MFATIRRKLKWSTTKSTECNKNENSFLFVAFIGLFEDVLFWNKMWLSLLFIVFLNLFFFFCVHQEINFLQFIFKLTIVVLVIDALETWLKYKHRTTCLKKLASCDITKFNSATVQLSNWMNKRWLDYVFLRERNHTKAFLLLQIIFGVAFFVCKHISGYTIMYFLTMFICFSKKLLPPIVRLVRKIQLNTESDLELELEGLIPEASDANMDLLSIEQDQNQIIDEKQSLDYWKPEDLAIEEASDSSETSSSIVTNLSMEKMQTFEKDIETSDSSEDEYMPRIKQPEPLREEYRSTAVVEPANTWSNAAYNVFQNLGGAVVNMIYTSQDERRRNRVSSIDSSDGFEMIDKNDIL
ncbi:PREDICTED: uncharacterized protein LOC106128547 [Papilio xuthus]|uniref:Uncharacterized protein LOC106128547 n=1 Tax=Papilio xuthus TaxID=66420 RepID=A0AAJ6ZZL5_PAPXU|nr:PREDICTED: uncharacterized protein LOC106128547 [Papilio xuthus]